RCTRRRVLDVPVQLEAGVSRVVDGLGGGDEVQPHEANHRGDGEQPRSLAPHHAMGCFSITIHIYTHQVLSSPGGRCNVVDLAALLGRTMSATTTRPEQPNESSGPQL